MPMRVTLETKTATRHKILETARRLFTDNGFDSTTTRDIALAADIATGTLFNYFPTKEAVLASLAAEALAETDASTNASTTLDEALFALIAAGLRKLKPFRKHLPVLLETALSPLAKAPDEAAASLRTAHLEAVAKLIAAHARAPLSPTVLQLYWTLYTGVLAFWAADNSPKQEDTLALLDDSLDMFVAWLRAQGRANKRN
jgi:AcrR family transcriptional regulator